MDFEWCTKHKKWIEGYLMSNLIENQKLIHCNKPNEHIEVKSIEIKLMSLDVAFMLTNCYFVKITIQIRSEHVECIEEFNNEQEFHLVVKVQIFALLKYKSIVLNTSQTKRRTNWRFSLSE